MALTPGVRIPFCGIAIFLKFGMFIKALASDFAPGFSNRFRPAINSSNGKLLFVNALHSSSALAITTPPSPRPLLLKYRFFNESRHAFDFRRGTHGFAPSGPKALSDKSICFNLQLTFISASKI